MSAQLSATIATGPAAHVDVLKAVNDKLQDLVDSQSVVTLQHRADYDDLAARGHDLIVVTMLPMILAGLMAGVLLAHSVTGSLDRMDSLIKSIEADQRSSAIEVLGAGQFAEQIDAAAARSSESLQRLLEVIAGVDHAASEIFTVTEAQVASTRQVTERMSGISASTRSVAVDIRDAQETAHETERMSADMVQTAAMIGEQADYLRDQVGRFVLNLRSAGSSAPTAPAPTDTLEFQDTEPLRAAS